MVTKRTTKNTKAKAIPKKASAKKANLKTKQRPKWGQDVCLKYFIRHTS